jgi:hypothetical protein
MHLFFDKIIFLKERRNCISLIKNSQSFIYIYIYIFFFFILKKSYLVLEAQLCELFFLYYNSESTMS